MAPNHLHPLIGKARTSPSGACTGRPPGCQYCLWDLGIACACSGRSSSPRWRGRCWSPLHTRPSCPATRTGLPACKPFSSSGCTAPQDQAQAARCPANKARRNGSLTQLSAPEQHGCAPNVPHKPPRFVHFRGPLGPESSASADRQKKPRRGPKMKSGYTKKNPTKFWMHNIFRVCGFQHCKMKRQESHSASNHGFYGRQYQVPNQLLSEGGGA